MQSNPKAEHITKARTLAVIAVALFASLACAAAASAQAKKPVSREGLVRAVRVNGLSTAELIEQIGQRGVSFEMTADAEAELRQAGALPAVIVADRRIYRPGVTH